MSIFRLASKGWKSPNLDVFISYSSLDKQIADAVKHGLHSAGIRCWMAPDDIASGKDWAAEIILAIEQCPVMVLIWTQASMSSLEVPKELGLAMRSGSIVIPFRLENIQPEGSFKYHLSGRHWLDVYDKSLDLAIDELIAQVRVSMRKSDLCSSSRTPNSGLAGQVCDEPLTGDELISKIKGSGDISLSQLVGACRYTRRLSTGKELPRINDFCKAVDSAKGMRLLETWGIRASGPALVNSSKPLKGNQLITKVKEFKYLLEIRGLDVLDYKAKLVRCCGYVLKKPDGAESLNFTAFYEALLEAKDISPGSFD